MLTWELKAACRCQEERNNPPFQSKFIELSQSFLHHSSFPVTCFFLSCKFTDAVVRQNWGSYDIGSMSRWHDWVNHRRLRGSSWHTYGSSAKMGQDLQNTLNCSTPAQCSSRWPECGTSHGKEGDKETLNVVHEECFGPWRFPFNYLGKLFLSTI